MTAAAAPRDTLIHTAKLNDIDPQAWLAHVPARLSDHPASSGPLRQDPRIGRSTKAASRWSHRKRSMRIGNPSRGFGIGHISQSGT
jgi:IS66 C-terminal element